MYKARGVFVFVFPENGVGDRGYLSGRLLRVLGSALSTETTTKSTHVSNIYLSI